MTVRFGTIGSILAVLMVGGCSGLWGNDEFERYSQRTDAITMSDGDANKVNAVTQMNDPWPPVVGDRRIFVDGVRMQRAVERYRRGASPPDPLPLIPEQVQGRPMGTVPGPTEGAGLSSLPQGSSVNVPVGGR